MKKVRYASNRISPASSRFSCTTILSLVPIARGRSDFKSTTDDVTEYVN